MKEQWTKRKIEGGKDSSTYMKQIILNIGCKKYVEMKRLAEDRLTGGCFKPVCAQLMTEEEIEYSWK